MANDRKYELLDRYEVLGNNEDYVEALALYEAALAETPDDPDILREYGYLQECKSSRLAREAADAYEKAICIKPDHWRSYRQLLMVRSRLLEENRFVDFVKPLLANSPEEPRFYELLACGYLYAGQVEEAQKVLEVGMALWPDDPSLIKLTGDVHEKNDRYDEAIACWRQAVEGYQKTNEGISGWFSCAFLLTRLERYEEAAQTWRDIIDWLVQHDYGDHIARFEPELAKVEAKLKEQKG